MTIENPWKKDDDILIVFGRPEKIMKYMANIKPKAFIKLLKITDYVNEKFKVTTTTTDEALPYLKGGMLFFYAHFDGAVQEFYDALNSSDALQAVLDVIDSTNVDDDPDEPSNTILIGIGKGTYVLTVDMNIVKENTYDVLEAVQTAQELGWPEQFEEAPVSLPMKSGETKKISRGVAYTLGERATHGKHVINPHGAISNIPRIEVFTCYRRKKLAVVKDPFQEEVKKILEDIHREETVKKNKPNLTVVKSD